MAGPSIGRDPPAMGEPWHDLLRRQDGTISRAQLIAEGLQPHDIVRLVRRRDLVRVSPGVFVDHTGDPTWEQRAWAGIHLFGPDAALDGRTALRAAMGQRWRHHADDDPIEIAVPAHLRKRAVPGYVVRRRRGYEAAVLRNASPPRLRVEHAALLSALRLDELDSVQLLADVCQSRRTTAARLLETVAGMARIPRRDWVAGVLDDIAGGTCSVLEHGYLTRVERPHGLPAGRRQRAVHGGRRDVEYDGVGQVVELDGRLFHDPARQRDVDLDLVAAIDREHTVRLGWGQVFARPCQTATRMAALLRSQGWSGPLVACSPGCPVTTMWMS